MKKRHIAGGALALLLVAGGTAAYVVTPTVHSGSKGEAPELGRSGEYVIGTGVSDFALENRTQIDGWGALTGSVKPAERRISVRIWYPGNAQDSAETVNYPHTLTPAGQEPVEITSQGIAVSTVAPLQDTKFPLVLMSHGFNGWDTQFSNLGEHLASHGYVVASIDHGDAPIEGMSDFLISFANVLTDRTQDQQQVLAQLLAKAGSGDDPVLAMVDPEKVGLIGYSMGGYGALATAGADYTFAGEPMSNLPEAAQQQLRDATQEAAPIDALVTFAPWGGQPDSRVWTAESLAKITAPTLIVSGNQDDVVNFREGVTWLFENLTGADRHLLVYREARHNIIGNAFTLPDGVSFTAAEYLNEPVWRSDRLNAINQHFVTAFLDLHLKGEEHKAAYLAVPSTDSNDSSWKIAFGEQLNGKLAGDGETDHWRGFQRRWALGMDLYLAKTGERGSLDRD